MKRVNKYETINYGSHNIYDLNVVTGNLPISSTETINVGGWSSADGGYFLIDNETNTLVCKQTGAYYISFNLRFYKAGAFEQIKSTTVAMFNNNTEIVNSTLLPNMNNAEDLIMINGDTIYQFNYGEVLKITIETETTTSFLLTKTSELPGAEVNYSSVFIQKI